MIQTETKVFDEKLTQVNLSSTKEVATIEQDDRENNLTKLQGQQTKNNCSNPVDRTKKVPKIEITPPPKEDPKNQIRLVHVSTALPIRPKKSIIIKLPTYDSSSDDEAECENLPQQNDFIKSKCDQDIQQQFLPSATAENHPFSNQSRRPKDIVIRDEPSAETVFVEDTTVGVHQASNWVYYVYLGGERRFSLTHFSL